MGDSRAIFGASKPRTPSSASAVCMVSGMEDTDELLDLDRVQLNILDDSNFDDKSELLDGRKSEGRLLPADDRLEVEEEERVVNVFNDSADLKYRRACCL